MSRIAVLGTGSWGTALALNLARRPDHRVTLWAHTAEHAKELSLERENRRYLPGFSLPPFLTVTGELPEALAGVEAVVIAVPSQYVRFTVSEIRPLVPSGALLVSASKGIEDKTLLRMTEVFAAALNEDARKFPLGVLSGPSFAREVAAGAPAAVTIAFAKKKVAETAQAMLSTDTMRLYRNTDVIGVELGGALKNVIAIAAGVVAGLELGHNSVAALITRGIAEITRLAVACGGRRETLAGLAGVGDLVLTCTGALSRNRSVGYELGKGKKLPEIIEQLGGKVAEGIRTTHAALELAQQMGVSMPIAEQVQAILEDRRSPAEAVRELMSRPGGDE